MYERSSGVLLHISSLPGQHGIGDFGSGAYEFVDFLYKAKQKYWQVLPLGLTGYCNSPYSSFSAFAGNPYFIDLDELIKSGYLSKEDVINAGFSQENSIAYDYLYENKVSLLRQAYKNAKEEIKEDLEHFHHKHYSWIDGFSLYMSLKELYEYRSWKDWDNVHRKYHSPEVMEHKENNREEMNFWVFTQYCFYKQWFALKKYANNLGIKIIGDLPIYVSKDSADVWSNPSLFHFDEELMPITVAGNPPDAFSPTGQLWGNPIYNWDAMEKDGYKWWIYRIKQSLQFYDTLRIDHFRGFESYWEIKYGAENAMEGRWVKGPGIKLFDKIKEELGEVDIIAEDLGVSSDDVKELLHRTGYPGMKVLQFAFDIEGDSEHLPHNYNKKTVVYTGTHDNPPVNGWLKTASDEEKAFARKYFHQCSNEETHWAFIRGAWSSTAYLAIAQMQDFLGLDEMARMNTPSTIGCNWTWRLRSEDLSTELAEKIAELTTLYRREL